MYTPINRERERVREHYLSKAACLTRPPSFSAFSAVSKTIVARYGQFS